MNISVGRAVCCTKMRIPVVLLLFVCSSYCAPLGIYVPDDLRPKLRNDVPFMNRIGDWFRHLKERICEKLFGVSAPTGLPPVSPELLDLNMLALQRQLQNHEMLQIDLSKLSFNPDMDLGFRIGHWYFIRTSDARNMFHDNDSSTEQAINPPGFSLPSDEVTGLPDGMLDLGEADDLGPSRITSITDVTEAPSTNNATESITYTVTESMTQTDLPEGSDMAMNTDKTVEDNEADPRRKDSVEVLM